MPILNIWDLLMVIGIAQGMIMAFVLWFKKGLYLSARFLGTIFFVLAFGSLGVYLSQIDPEPTSAFYNWVSRYVPFYLYMLLGPSLLFMIQSKADMNFSFNRKKKVHYLAVLYNLIPTATWISAWLLYKLDLPQYDKEQFFHFLYGFLTYGDIGYFVHLSIYTLLARKYLNKKSSDKDKKLHQIITAFQAFLVVYLPFMLSYLYNYAEIIKVFGYYPVFIPITILIYWLGFQWFFYLYQSKQSVKKLDIDIEKINIVLDAEMAAGLYLDPDLTVRTAAKKLGIPQRVLSQYVNQHLQKSFNDYVNNYRVDEVKRKLTDQNYEHLTIAAIAHDSGFKSIATFQRAFKKLVGVSPLAYKNQLKSNPQITI